MGGPGGLGTGLGMGPGGPLGGPGGWGGPLGAPGAPPPAGPGGPLLPGWGRDPLVGVSFGRGAISRASGVAAGMMRRRLVRDAMRYPRLQGWTTQLHNFGFTAVCPGGRRASTPCAVLTSSPACMLPALASGVVPLLRSGRSSRPSPHRVPVSSARAVVLEYPERS